MEYRIKRLKFGGWVVYSGRVSYGDFIKEKIVYESDTIIDCYGWIKAKQEGLLYEE